MDMPPGGLANDVNMVGINIILLRMRVHETEGALEILITRRSGRCLMTCEYLSCFRKVIVLSKWGEGVPSRKCYENGVFDIDDCLGSGVWQGPRPIEQEDHGGNSGSSHRIGENPV